jgi:hypothetical protein
MNALLARPDASANDFPLDALADFDKMSWGSLFRFHYFAETTKGRFKIIAPDYIPSTPTPAEIAELENAKPTKPKKVKALRVAGAS